MWIMILCLLRLAICFLEPPDRFSADWLVSDVDAEFSPFAYPELAQITAEPLHYLGHGLQSIAYATSDGRYVLKFFLTKKFRPYLHIRKGSAIKTRIDLLHRYDTAFRLMAEETGLIAVHLSAASSPLPSCTLCDPAGRPHLIDLSRASFVVQRRGSPLPQDSTALLQPLLEARAKKGFTDHKERINAKNFALVDGKAIMIDVGNVVFSEELKKNPEQELERIKQLLMQYQ